MNAVVVRSLVVAVLLAGALDWLHALGIGLRLLLGAALFLSVVLIVAPRLGVRWLDDAILAVRTLFWKREQGRFHAFAGIPLDIEDDGLHQWLAAEGLMRALGKREPEAALAARHAGRWRRTDAGVLLLRVDAVVDHLNTMPGRDDPRVQRLRRYFEREVLFPASQRRARSRASA